MNIAELSTLVGLGMSVVTLLVGAVQRDRQLMSKISEQSEKTSKEIATIRENFVSKSELERHLERIEKSIAKLEAANEKSYDKFNAKLDLLLASRSKEIA